MLCDVTIKYKVKQQQKNTIILIFIYFKAIFLIYNQIN